MSSFPIIRTGTIRWEISQDSPRKLSLKFMPGFKLINPYHYSKAYEQNHLLEKYPTLIGSNCILQTTGLILENMGEVKDLDANEVHMYIALFLKYLRFESRQTSINPSYIYTIHTERSLPKGISAQISPTSNMAMNATYYHTLLRWDQVVKASIKLYKQMELPVFEEMLLEAYAAWINLEFNKVLLFSTIAIESLLAHSYDRLYEQEIKRISPSEKLRIVKDPMGNIKDPVWKALMDRTDFKKLLHEAPLYLMKRSILLENEKLYKGLIKLYSTRNKIVHWGAPLNHIDDHLIELNEIGAYEGLKMAIEVFRWMNIKRYDFMLEKKFISIDDKTSHK